MAVVFTPHSTGSSIVIGGQSGSGPFPKYSVSKSTTILPSEGTVLNSKYAISVSGKIIVDSSVDITDPGARQSIYNAMAMEKINWIKQNPNAMGKLEIIPYGGKPGKIIFNDAKLISTDISESPDDSSAVLYTDYNFSFEATVDVSVGDGSISLPQFNYDTYFIDSIEESWSVSIDEDVNYINDDLTKDPEKTFSITHTVRATGLRKPLSGGGFDKSAWYEAQKWVNSRLVSSPMAAITADFLGGNQITSFDPRYFGNAATASFNDLTTYSHYNHVRTPESSLTEGSYGVVETWKVSRKPYTVELNIDTDISQDGLISMNMNGSITGLDSSLSTSNTVKKLSNAEIGLAVVEDNAYSLCKKYYDMFISSNSYDTSLFNLKTIPDTKSIGRNPGTGVITFNYGFNDKPVLISNSLSTDITIVDDNEFWEMEIVAIIPIIAKVDGPIIQRMGTSKERKRSLQLDAVMQRSYRAVKPNGRAVVFAYAPTGDNVTIQSIIENWSPINGAYSLSVEWVY